MAKIGQLMDYANNPISQTLSDQFGPGRVQHQGSYITAYELLKFITAIWR